MKKLSQEEYLVGFADKSYKIKFPFVTPKGPNCEKSFSIGSAQSTHISIIMVQRSVKIMETWFATHTEKIYRNGEKDVKPATNSILNLKWDLVL